AHGEGGLVLPSHVIVGGDQRLDGRAVGRNVKRNPAGQILQVGRRTADLFHSSLHLLGVGVGGIPAVKALADHAVFHLNGAADDGQRIEQAVVGGNPQRAAIVGRMQRLQYL